MNKRPLSQWVLIGVVGAALIVLGFYDVLVRQWLADLFTDNAAAVPPPVRSSGGLTTRNVPAMVVYGLSYIGLSIAFLHLFLANLSRTRIVLLTYGAALGLIGALLVAGRVLGLGDVLTPIARELIDGGGSGGGILSPLPILLLLAVFRLAPRA
jgi:hypothetical protein